ncbi:MRGX1 protein, partial [Piaya cayana]|nr:MRGX1 protein [Piaya cayana]
FFFFSPAMQRTDPACRNQPGEMEYNRTGHPSLLRYEDDCCNWTDCDAGHLSKVPVTLLVCLCGLAGNGAVLWFLGSWIRKNPSTVCTLNLAIANFTFLLSITIALGLFYVPESFCHRLGPRAVATALNVTILFSFAASVYLLAAFGATMSLSVLPSPCCPCHRSPALLCALLWVLALLLAVTLYFYPAMLVIFVLSYLLSVLTLIFSALTLLARLLCCSWPFPPRNLCVLVLLAVTFPFLTADFGYWLLLRVFDFSAFAFDGSFPLACVNSSINPLIYFLAGSCAKKLTLSAKAAFQRAFEDATEPQESGEPPSKNSVES